METFSGSESDWLLMFSRGFLSKFVTVEQNKENGGWNTERERTDRQTRLISPSPSHAHSTEAATEAKLSSLFVFIVSFHALGIWGMSFTFSFSRKEEAKRSTQCDKR